MSTQRIWASLDPFLESGPMLGRIQANEGFLDGLLSVDPFDAYHFFPASLSACRQLEDGLKARWPAAWEAGRLVVRQRRELRHSLSRQDYHVFHLSDCIVSPGMLAQARNAWSGQIFPITSVTHSLSYARYGQDFLRHISPCTTARDCVVATSRAAVGVVGAYYDTLRQGYGLDPERFTQPQVAHIPLGVDLRRFRPPDPQRRREARDRFGFGQQVVFLVLARLSHSSKMDFLPILRAFQRLALDGVDLSGLRLVLAGWNEEQDWGRSTLQDLARNVGLPLMVVERPDEQAKLDLYAGADVFLSPSDNVQETFGLTLLEAQACGLPVIASDFDGYRDLVRPGVTGVLLPTLGAALTGSLDLDAAMGFDNHTHLALAQRLAVDVQAMARGLAELAANPGLRRDMGLAAVENASGYGWDAIARRHVDLWNALWAAPVLPRPSAEHPGTVRYARVFAGYPTRLFGPGVALRISRLGQAVYRGQDFPLVYDGLERVAETEVLRALLVLARKPVDADLLARRLLEAVAFLDEETAQAAILWCLKHDLLERADG